MGLDSVELVIAVEEEFDINIPDEKAAKIETAGKLYQYVLENYNENQSITQAKADEVDVWRRIKRLIVYQLGVKAEQVTKEANFVHDLGMD